MAQQVDIQHDPVEQAVEQNKPAARRRLRIGRPSATTVVAVVVLVTGLGIIAYPTVSDWWNSYHQYRDIADYVTAVQNTDAEKLDAMRQEAIEYNQRLLNDGNRFSMSEAEKAEYEKLLDLTGNGVMGYVQINAINVDYPIYHGMDEKVLQVAVGHLEGTSLPVGGPDCHTAISGHRGLPSARLFTDLDRLVEGDTFSIERGKDYATLITCTPYSVNTHRMLVRGHRIDDILDAQAVTAGAIQIPRYIAITAVGVPMLFVFLIGMLVYYRTRRPDLDKEAVVSELIDVMSKRDSRTEAKR